MRVIPPKGFADVRNEDRRPQTNTTVKVLARPGDAYAIYFNRGTGAELDVELPAGNYGAEWVNTKNGRVEKDEAFNHGGGTRTMSSPAYSEDIALRLTRKKQ